MKCKQCHQPRPNHKLDCSHPDAQVDRLQNMVESLAARLAAWEPVVAAAEEMRKRWDERASPAKQQAAQVAVVVACRRVPEEHRP